MIEHHPLKVNSRVAIPRHELHARASRSGGPGGQHVNTSSTRIELEWNVRDSSALSRDERARVLDKLASRIDGNGTIRVVASDSRSQRQNRELAEGRLAELVRRALVVPRARKATKPTRASQEKRIEAKKHHSRIKRERGRPLDD